MNTLIKKTKYDYYKTEINKNKNNIKKVYQIINKITGSKNKKANNNLKILNDNQKEFTNNLEMADYCNKYFINVGSELEKQIKVPKKPFKLSLNNSTNASMYLPPVTDQELIQHISTLKSGSAPGKDEISSDTIKSIHIQIIAPLKHIPNKPNLQNFKETPTKTL